MGHGVAVEACSVCKAAGYWQHHGRVRGRIGVPRGIALPTAEDGVTCLASIRRFVVDTQDWHRCIQQVLFVLEHVCYE